MAAWNAAKVPVWIIPAYAGSTCSPGSCRPVRPDHPRIRGEHARYVDPSSGMSGSSPHTRGARLHDKRMGSRSADHPRIRGEHRRDHPAKPRPAGSSPHTRGALLQAQPEHEQGRIIPAYAGSTGHVEGAFHFWPDHPRIRGEHVQMNRAIADGSGSSPHTRGAHQYTQAMIMFFGIIPAYAGSTGGAGISGAFDRDHPRIRGEHR